MMAGLGHSVDVVAVAELYRGLIDTLVIDEADAGRAPEIEEMGIRPIVTGTVMRDAASSERLARVVLDAAGLAE
jgi:LPPG:FO 2-phospho-L-lactate transferase